MMFLVLCRLKLTGLEDGFVFHFQSQLSACVFHGFFQQFYSQHPLVRDGKLGKNKYFAEGGLFWYILYPVMLVNRLTLKLLQVGGFILFFVAYPPMHVFNVKTHS